MLDPIAHRRLWFRWLWPVALAVTVVVASGRGQVATPKISDFDKIAHFMIFGLLATLLVRTPTGLRRAWIPVAVTSFFGVCDEIHQSFTPGRSIDIADWISDTVGATLAVMLYVRWAGYRRVLEWPIFGMKPKRRIETTPATVPKQVA